MLRGLRAAMIALTWSACSGLGGGPLPALAQTGAVVVVDAATPVAVSTSGDDLATLRNIFQGANAPQEPTFAPMASLVADLGLKRMRILLGDQYADLTSLAPDGQFVTAREGEWDLLTSYLDNATSHGLSPHVAVAAYMPRAFVPMGPAATWSGSTLGRYKDYALALARYIVQRSFDHGAPSVLFEVGNELDIADYAPVNHTYEPTPSSPPQALLPLGPWGRMLWWIDPATYSLDRSRNGFPDGYPFGGDIRRVGQGVAPVQKIWNDVVAIVKAENPGRSIAIAGPAFSGFSFQQLGTDLPQTSLEELFLDHMFDSQTEQGRYNSSIDYVSFHYYRNFRDGWGGPTTALSSMSLRLRTKLSDLGASGVQLFISEWGPTLSSPTDMPERNYSHDGAAWTAAFLVAALNEKVTIGSYLLIGDAAGNTTTGVVPEASLMAKIDDVYHYKPPANVMRMFAMMSGTRRAAALPGDRPNLGAFATADASSAGVVVYNFNSTFTTGSETVAVRFDNLPFDGPVTVERYLVDADTSNLRKFIVQATTPDPQLTRLQRVEQFPAMVQSGQLVLDARTLGPSAVSFWRVLQ